MLRCVLDVAAVLVELPRHAPPTLQVTCTDIVNTRYHDIGLLQVNLQIKECKKSEVYSDDHDRLYACVNWPNHKLLTSTAMRLISNKRVQSYVQLQNGFCCVHHCDPV